jgi:hypothetical protein
VRVVVNRSRLKPLLVALLLLLGLVAAEGRTAPHRAPAGEPAAAGQAPADTASGRHALLRTSATTAPSTSTPVLKTWWAACLPASGPCVALRWSPAGLGRVARSATAAPTSRTPRAPPTA